MKRVFLTVVIAKVPYYSGYNCFELWYVFLRTGESGMWASVEAGTGFEFVLEQVR